MKASRRASKLAAALLVLAGASCKTSHEPGAAEARVVAKESGQAKAADGADVLRAENLRRTEDLGAEPRATHDVRRRRRLARAFARIGDAKSVEHLRALLADDDPETVAWAAYGLGYACKGNEDDHVTRIAARAASLRWPAVAVTAGADGAAIEDRAEQERATLDPRLAMARAVGKCASPTSAEAALVAWLGDPAWRAAAIVGLGDLAVARKTLGDRAVTALLDAVEARQGAPDDMVFYALSRAKPLDAFRARVVRAARAALGRSGPARVFAVKALARYADRDASGVAEALARVVTDGKGFTPAERAEAARGLTNAGGPGREAAGAALAKLVASRDDASVAGPEFNVWYTLIGVLGATPPESAEATLGIASRLPAPPSAGSELRRRYAELRCAAALGLARAVSDADVLLKCDDTGSEISERARLASLLQRPLVRERRAAFTAFVKSAHRRVREKAVEAVGVHPELGDLAASTLADALASDDAGLVATAAEVLHAHPELGRVLAESERRAGLDPHAPPPSSSPAKELSPRIDHALATALTKSLPEDLFETRIALVEAAASLHHRDAKAAASAACTDANGVVRDRARKALRALGEDVSACMASPKSPALAPEIDAGLLAKPTRLVLRTEMRELGIVLEPELSPVTATRIASLVRSHFYDGIVVHRVVPGFVAQFGDPNGDGYGGSGTSLRCETSPVPFGPLDVGMALAGRDAGSSQLFVTLARTPHLDGEYTRVGRATGDWDAVAEGETILEARLVGDE